MKSIRTSIDIAAPPSLVFHELADFARWSEWNPVMSWVRGQPWVGGRVAAVVRVEGLLPFAFVARVVRFERDAAIAWAGGVPGVARGEHFFELEVTGDGGTRLRHGEDFTGALVERAMVSGVERRLVAAYESMNEALAARVARRAR